MAFSRRGSTRFCTRAAVARKDSGAFKRTKKHGSEFSGECGGIHIYRARDSSGVANLLYAED